MGTRTAHRRAPHASRQLTGDAGSVRSARALVEELMAGRDPEQRDVAVLLTDELVTNALLHGGGRFSLAVQVDDQTLRVAVTDASPKAPQVLQPSEDSEHGRGMAIVDALATAWGTERLPRRKTVWFELGLRG